ncbi:MAG TPA: NRDE family protein [Steroidobacteraceae bacterium]
MCLLIIGWNVHPRFRLVVAANRDEFHARPAAPLAKWPPPGEILAGRDIQAGGTWLGVDRHRRVGVVTNFRDMQPPRPGARSRGELIPSFLTGSSTPQEFMTALEARASEYSGFNLLLADAQELWYASNRAQPFARRLPPGVYGLSNHFLDTPWPKLARVRRKFEQWLQTADGSSDELFAMLNDREPPDPVEPLDASGRLPAELVRAISAPFVLHPEYGTRCSTVVRLGHAGTLDIIEHRFNPAGALNGETEFHLNETEWP